mgnify:CR=1 FL=1
MDSKKLIVGVAPVGDAPVFAAKIIAAHISGYLNLNTEIAPALSSPSFAFDEKRFQYNAGAILKSYDAMGFNCHKLIALLNVDIFVPIFTHVFGEARQGGKCGLVSIFRLQMEQDGFSPAPPLVYERAAKVALHELGHLFNLLHCEDNRCLMHFSGGLDQLDRTPFYFCRYCSKFFQDSIVFKS